DTGHVENKVVTIPEDIMMGDLEQFVNLLNSKLKDAPLVQVRSKLYNEISSELSKYIARHEELLYMLEQVWEGGLEEKLYVSGATNMLSQPEFKDVEKVKIIFDLFDESETLSKLVMNAPDGIQVRIGSENSLEAIHQCSLITATYTINGQSLGTIGILGPTRMEYAKVMGLMDYLSKDLAVILSRWYK